MEEVLVFDNDMILFKNNRVYGELLPAEFNLKLVMLS